MGACGSSSNAEGSSRSKAIEAQNREAFIRDSKVVKLLLLGAGESGKSTIFKQMKILYGKDHGFMDDFRAQQVTIVRANIVSNMRVLLQACEEFTPAEKEDLAKDYLKATETEEGMANEEVEFDQELTDLTEALWEDAGVMDTWKHRANFQVQDSLAYYLPEIQRIGAEDYSPVDQDILHARVRTTGIVEEHFVIDDIEFAMFDVGGQRNERKKWIHCFDDVTAIMYVAAISAYDQVLYEESSTNRMDEAVNVFASVVNNPVFSRTGIILFLNKIDLFDQKIIESPFRVEEGPRKRNLLYKGPNAVGLEKGSKEYLDARKQMCDFVVERFLNASPRTSGDIYCHFTCATDSNNIKKIFNASRDIILKINLGSMGFEY